MCGWAVLQGDFMGVGIKYKWETHEAAAPAFTPGRGLPTEEVLACECQRLGRAQGPATELGL